MQTEREFAIEVVRRLQQAGFEALFAGGCVRDELLGLEPADYDVATNARPEQVRAIFRNVVEVGVAFGVIEVIGPRLPEGGHLMIQVATFRSDGEYLDGRRPVDVTFCTAEKDAQRRDFTINGMFFDPIASKLYDYVGGQHDLEVAVLRAIGDPRERIKEDKLRMLRAARMAMRFDLRIEPATHEAIRALAKEITIVSPERIADELRKMLVHPRRAEGMHLLEELSLLAPILPEVAQMKSVPQGTPSARTGDLWTHVVKVLEMLEGPTWPTTQPVSFELAFGTLLHDIGKPLTFVASSEKYSFHGHEHAGKDVAKRIGRNLKLSNDERARIEFLVEKHQYLCDAPIMRASKLKPILVHPGIGELLALHKADSLASGREIAHVEFCERLLRETPESVLNPPPLITGDDLTARGLKPGPLFKQLLDAVRESQLEGTITTATEAMEMVEKTMEAKS